MVRSIVLGSIALLAGCATLPSPPGSPQATRGQLFCSVALSPKATTTVALIETLSSGVPEAVLAEGAAASVVAADCAKIGGIPVTPPATAVPAVAITPSVGDVTAPLAKPTE